MVLIGRDTERDAIRAALDRGSRFVLLVGPGGAGKTTLAASLPGAVLAGVAASVTAAELADTVRASLQLADGASVSAALAARDGLVVLDNLEQLDGDALRAISGWLATAPGLRLVGTSRRRLGLVHEHVIPVGPLAPDDAARLFAERVARAGGSVEGLEPARIVRLCDRLDRLPLALELAAGRLPALGLGGLERHLGDPTVLADPGPDREPRQATLDAVVRWSWELLSPVHRRALAELSTLAGSFSTDDAAYTATTAVLAALVDASLVRVERAGAEVRYALYESVRAWASARLAEDPGDAADRTVRHLLDRARPLADAADGPDGLAAVAALRPLVPLLVPLAPRAPVEVALAVDPVIGADGPMALRRRLLREAVAADPLAAQPLALLAQSEPGSVPIEALERLLPHVAGDVRAELEVRHGIGRGLWTAGRLAEAEAVLAEAAALAEHAGTARDIVAATYQLAGVRWANGRQPSAVDAYRRALALASGTASPTVVALVRGNLGLVLNDLAEPGAERLLRDAVDGLAAVGDHRRSSLLIRVADVALERGAPAEALERIADALDVIRRSGQLRWEGHALSYRAHALDALDCRGEARATFAEAEASSSVHGHPVVTAMIACWRGRLLGALGEIAEAEAAIARGRPVLERAAFRHLAELCAARVALARGDRAAAEEALDAAAEDVGTVAEIRVASAWLRRELAREAPVLRIGDTWFAAPGGERVELGTRHAIRRVLHALADAHGPLDVPALFAAGWPGEQAVRDAARDRVYHAVSTLRKLGLEAWLVREERGWRLTADLERA